jgi:DNA adenine methylase
MALNLDLFSVAPVSEPTRPFLKWAGGKSKLLNRILPVIAGQRRLIEPFIGSAVVAINAPHEAVLASDQNRDLILTYHEVQRDPQAVIDEARTLFLPETNARESFDALRAEFNNGAVGKRRAALFIYLNRHGFNGLCRYNGKGKFNVPFGRYDSPQLPAEAIRSFARLAHPDRVSFEVADFEALMEQAGPGDAVYCDPPYVPLSASASFTGYAEGAFGPTEQERLARAARRAASRGAVVAISNHDTPYTRSLYEGACIEAFPVQRMISAKGDDRWAAREVLAVFGART